MDFNKYTRTGCFGSSDIDKYIKHGHHKHRQHKHRHHHSSSSSSSSSSDSSSPIYSLTTKSISSTNPITSYTPHTTKSISSSSNPITSYVSPKLTTTTTTSSISTRMNSFKPHVTTTSKSNNSNMQNVFIPTTTTTAVATSASITCAAYMAPLKPMPPIPPEVVIMGGAATVAGGVTGAVVGGACGTVAGAATQYVTGDKECSKKVGTVVGAVTGGVAGGYVGTQIMPGVGTVTGGVAGAVAGGYVGGKGAEWAADKVEENRDKLDKIEIIKKYPLPKPVPDCWPKPSDRDSAPPPKSTTKTETKSKTKQKKETYTDTETDTDTEKGTSCGQNPNQKPTQAKDTQQAQIELVDPYNIRFSQDSVNYRSHNGPNFYEVFKSMQENGFTEDFSPINVVRMEDGKLTTFDNRRVLVGRLTFTKMRVIIHNHDDPILEEWRRKNGNKTWGDLVREKIKKQKSAEWNKNGNGSDKIPQLKGMPKIEWNEILRILKQRFPDIRIDENDNEVIVIHLPYTNRQYFHMKFI